eukprot:CAMPEP_0169419942 /NCGR_PEP_ID=MMETSP1017-20121227/65275_1 /TAXON_ID=342587 /ORGANISM="Karlodinium micrum, Strain CCMP2283" /LENGTH=80 /DNA_ID=CAMNT_0009528691 /DNA_START=600 /DNA_END=838 /DNA_ORIENTATION=-
MAALGLPADRLGALCNTFCSFTSCRGEGERAFEKRDGDPSRAEATKDFPSLQTSLCFFNGTSHCELGPSAPSACAEVEVS